MPEKTIAVQFFTYSGGRVAFKGQTVDLSDEDAARGDSLGAFEDSEATPGTDALAGAFGTGEGRETQKLEDQGNDNANVGNDVAYPEGLSSTGGAAETPQGPTGQGSQPGPGASAVTAEQIDSLTGEELQAACDEASINTSTGGSLSGGALSADEKRAALKAHHGV